MNWKVWKNSSIKNFLSNRGLNVLKHIDLKSRGVFSYFSIHTCTTRRVEFLAKNSKNCYSQVQVWIEKRPSSRLLQFNKQFLIDLIHRTTHYIPNRTPVFVPQMNTCHRRFEITFKILYAMGWCQNTTVKVSSNSTSSTIDQELTTSVVIYVSNSYFDSQRCLITNGSNDTMNGGLVNGDIFA